MRFPRNETLTVQRRFVRGDSFALPYPSSPRRDPIEVLLQWDLRRGSRLADVATLSLTVARLDSRLRGNDEPFVAYVAEVAA
jgi:hypothetical protein